MIFTSEALKKWRDSDAERETGEDQVDLCGRHKWIVKTFNDNLKEFQVSE